MPIKIVAQMVLFLQLVLINYFSCCMQVSNIFKKKKHSKKFYLGTFLTVVFKMTEF